MSGEMSGQYETLGNNVEKLWTKFFILALSSNLFFCLAMTTINSIIARYTLALYGNAAFSGYLNAAFAVLAIIARLVCGDLSDRRGRVKVMLFGAGIFAVSSFCFGVFPYAAALIIFRSLHGFGYATANTAINAAGADVLPEKRMSEGIGYLGLGFSLATALGAAIALSLVVGDDYSMVFYGATGMIIISMVIALFLRYEKLPFYQNKIKEQKERSAAIDLSEYKGLKRIIEFKALPAALVQLFNSTAFSAVNFFIVIYADSKGLTGSATFFAIMAVGMTFTRFFCGRIADKYGEKWVAGCSLCLQVVGLILLISAANNYVFYAVGFLIGMAFGTVSPVLQGAAVKNSPVNRKGAASGVYQMANDIAQGIGAILWGLVIDNMGFTAAFVGCIICTLVSLALIPVFFGKRRNRATQ